MLAGAASSDSSSSPAYDSRGQCDCTSALATPEFRVLWVIQTQLLGCLWRKSWGRCYSCERQSQSPILCVICAPSRMARHPVLRREWCQRREEDQQEAGFLMFAISCVFAWLATSSGMCLFGFFVGRCARKLPFLDDVLPWTMHREGVDESRHDQEDR